MKKLFGLVFAVIVAVAIAGAAGGGSSGSSTSGGTSARPGSPQVYAEIAAETSCSVLQHRFDLAEQTHQRGGSWGPIGTSYMQAADARMRQLRCY